MNLKEFITATLVEIAEGVSEAQDRYNELNGVVNPSGFNNASSNLTYGQKGFGPGRSETMLLTNAEFEVSLTESNSSEGKGGIGVFLGSFSIGASDTNTKGNMSLTRVKFNIPLLLPRKNI